MGLKEISSLLMKELRTKGFKEWFIEFSPTTKLDVSPTSFSKTKYETKP